MINYSVYMMGNPIKPEMPEKAYAKAQVNEVIEFSQFVKHIADHNGLKQYKTTQLYILGVKLGGCFAIC